MGFVLPNNVYPDETAHYDSVKADMCSIDLAGQYWLTCVPWIQWDSAEFDMSSR